MQIASIILQVDIELPVIFRDVTAFINPDVFIYGFDCLLLPLAEYSNIPFIYMRYMYLILTPLAILIITEVYYRIKYSHNQTYKKLSLTTTRLIVFLFFQTSIVQEGVSMMSCRKIGEDQYMKANLNYSCDDQNNKIYNYSLVIPTIIMVAFFVPFNIYRRLSRHINYNNSTAITHKKYYYMNGEFKSIFFYWEFIRLGEKLLVGVIIEVLYDYVNLMTLMTMITVLLYGYYSSLKQPFINDENN